MTVLSLLYNIRPFDIKWQTFYLGKFRLHHNDILSVYTFVC